MQCVKLDLSIDIDKLLIIINPYIDKLLKIANMWPNDVIRVMTNYPQGHKHYTSNKRIDETWEIIENNDFTLFTKLTKFETRMVSVYYKEEYSWDTEIIQLINNLNVSGTPQIAISLASPKFRLEKHIDTRGLTRYHVPIITNEDSYFETFENPQKFYPKPGEVWKLDTSKEHAANNDSLTDIRVHMIVDFLND